MAIDRSDVILMVEDNPRDYKQAIRALEKAGCANEIRWCEDGDDALDFLYHKGKFEEISTSPRPGLILLDINLPGTDGKEVLATVKSDDDLKEIPIDASHGAPSAG